MRQVIAWVIGTVLAVTASTAAMADDIAAKRLADILSAAKSVEATFEQTVTGSRGVVQQESTGTMMVSRPQLFRWSVMTPFEQLIIADGKQVWVHDPDLSQVVVKPFDAQLADTPALLFSGDAKKIGDSFDVKIADENKKDNGIRFELAPRSEDALFTKMRIAFRGGKLLDMSLIDNLGQKTSIRFSNVKNNGPMAASLFVFTPPPGTDVIREAH